jgi:3-dehydroquinate synthase
VVCLTATAESIDKRLRGAKRPLLDAGAGIAGRGEKIRALLLARDGAYRRIPLHLDTDGRSGEEIAADIAALLDPWPLRIPVREERGGYAIEVTPGLADHLAPRLRPWLYDRAVVVTDTRVWRLVGAKVAGALREAGARADLVAIRPGEASKSWSTAGLLSRRLVRGGVDRRTLVIALGGGVVGDLAGFVAATVKRGLPLLHIPTTLVAQLDSSIGGKNGVNLPEAKNQVGTFHSPVTVLADPRLLATLAPRELRDGLAEAVKTAVLGSVDLFEILEENADRLARSGRRERAAGGSRGKSGGRDRPMDFDEMLFTRVVRLAAGVKARVVSADPGERGVRRVLNLGHTVGHALETAGGYGRLSHGEAVSIGMVAESRIARRLGLATARSESRIRELLERLGLPVEIPRVRPDRVLAAMARDKKAEANRIHVALPRRVGRVELVALTPAEVTRLMKE